jgi:putative ABC transport system permease protein
MLRNYLKIALRTLTRNAAFSIINVLGLALGLTCCLLILLYTKDEVSFDRFQERGDRLYRVVSTITDEKGTNRGGSTNSIHGPAFQREIPEIESVVRLQTRHLALRRGGELLSQEVLFADSTFFSVFTMPLRAGNPRTVLTGPRAVVLTEATAEKYFQSTDVLGKTIELQVGERFEPFVVSGVARNCPQNSSLQFEMLLPFTLQEQGRPSTEWIGFYLNTFVLLHPQADVRSVVPKLDRVFLSQAAQELKEARAKYDYKARIHFDLQPFRAIHLDSLYGDIRNGLAHASQSIYSYVLSGIALFILLIACINFVNLTVARSLRRGKEIGIRKVVGGGRPQLVRQFLGESYLLCFIAFSLALGLAQLALPTFNELANKQLALSYLFDATLVASYAGLFVVTGLLAGFYPALVLSGFHPVQTLYGRFRVGGKNYLTRGLVVLQFALSVGLLIGTFVIYRQFTYLTTKPLGYNDEHLLVLNLGWGNEPTLIDRFRAEFAGVPGIRAVAAKNPGDSYTLAKVDGRDIDFAYYGIDDQYLPTLQIPVVQGRNFSRTYPADPSQSVLINEAFARAAGWTKPLGKQVDFFYNQKKFTVVGVVNDYHYGSLKEKIGPQLFTQDPDYPLGELWVKLDPAALPETIRRVEQIHRKILPFKPFSYDFKDVSNARQYESEARWKQMITLATALFLFVSCLGLFGLAAFTAERRTKEIGIRKVMGASVLGIAALLSKDFLKLVLLGIIIAAPLAYFAARTWLAEFPYRIDLDPGPFLLAGTLAVGTALLTVSFQSVKAALMNPVKSLRSE